MPDGNSLKGERLIWIHGFSPWSFGSIASGPIHYKSEHHGQGICGGEKWLTGGREMREIEKECLGKCIIFNSILPVSQWPLLSNRNQHFLQPSSSF
jgi:hypothetical protein